MPPMLSRRTILTGALSSAALAGAPLLRQARGDAPGARKPYLQNDLGTSISVMWATRRRVQTLVRVRDAGGGRPRTVGRGARTLRHTVTIGELIPGGAYEYSVRTDGGFSPWQRFRTRPEGSDRFSFALLGDVGFRHSSQAAVIRMLEQKNPDLVLALGDLAYPTAEENTLNRMFFSPLARYAGGHVVWHVFGNHDVAADAGRPLDQASLTPRNGPTGLPPDRNYSFDYGNAHFVVIDSNLTKPQLERKIRPWLEADLAASAHPWKFISMHHPPFSTGPHGSAAKVRETLLPVMKQYGVDAVFAGHDHDYERFHPIDGITYLVSGNSGGILYNFPGPPPPEIAAREDRRFGLTVVDINGDRATITHTFIDGHLFDRAVLEPNPGTGPVARCAPQLELELQPVV